MYILFLSAFISTEIITKRKFLVQGYMYFKLPDKFLGYFPKYFIQQLTRPATM